MAFVNWKRSVTKLIFQTYVEELNVMLGNVPKKHPTDCYYFDKYGMCKFGFFCSYKHNNLKMEYAEGSQRASKGIYYSKTKC